MGAPTTFVQSSFLGGEVSQSMQGRTDRPDYRTFMNSALNTIPIESGACLRRPSTRHIAATRGGAPGRVIAYSFRENFPYNMEFTDGYLRFLTGLNLVMTNDAQAVVSVSSATPAVVATAAAHGWSSGNQAAFNTLAGAAQLANRAVVITVLSPTTFSIADALTGTGIDGSALDAFTSGNVTRILEIATPYMGGTWANLRSVQAEENAVLLNGTLPQVLSVALEPSVSQFATFTLTPANFLDGPYLDPLQGSWVAPSGQNGVVTLSFSFQTYSGAIAYNIGDYVTYSGVNYRSLIANNENFQPDFNVNTKWKVVNGGDPINAGNGFTSADVGRLIRLFSEPALWSAAATYAVNDVVAYDDGSGAFQYWKNASGAVINAGVVPGTTVAWSPLTPGAKWTWGRILSVSANGVAPPNTSFGSMTSGGGTAAAFDNNTSKTAGSSAELGGTATTFIIWQPTAWPLGTLVQYQGIVYVLIATGGGGLIAVPPPINPVLWRLVGPAFNLRLSSYVGGHYNTAIAVASVTVYPTTDAALTNGADVTLNLRAKATAPASASDGTLLGSTGVIANTGSPVSIVSGDQATTFHYVWIEEITNHYQPLPGNGGPKGDGSFIYNGINAIAQVVIYQPNIANGSVISVQIAGDALMYANTIRKWRLGAYGGTAGYPTCGTYHEGRAWFSGVIGNRIDGGKPIDSNGDLFNFAPTLPNGTVTDASAITATFEGPDVNTIRWMSPDQQGIICGTQAGEWLVSPSAPGALSPTNTSARRVTVVGCADIEPRRTDHTLVMVQKFRRKIMEYFADVYSGKLSAPSLSDKAEHLTVPNIAEIAYQQELAPIIWQRLDNGALIGTTYKRDKLTTQTEADISAPHRHVLGSGRSVESICVGPSHDGNLDALAMVTNDPASGIRHLEVMTDLLEEGFPQISAYFLDDAIVPSSIVIVAPSGGAPYGGLKINGLWPHNGKTVGVFVAGLDCGATTDATGQPVIADFVVADGSLTVPFGDGITTGNGGGAARGLFTEAYLRGISATLDLSVIQIAVGFPYTSQGQIVRPAQPLETGAGLGFAKNRKIDRYGAQLYGAINGTISFGVDFDKLRTANFKTKGGTDYTAQQQFSGIHREPLDADSDLDNMLCWEQSRPNAAAFVIALGGRVKVED